MQSPVDARLDASPAADSAGFGSERQPRRVIELSGLSGTGKTELSRAFAHRLPGGTRIGVRLHYRAPWRRPAYFGLMVAEARMWRSLYRVLRGTLPGRTARRRLRMYIKHLWRRRQQIRSGGVDIVIEDEAFATWFARDLERCPGFDRWLEVHAARFYPERVGGRAVEYVLVPVACAELVRSQRVHRRRLEQGPRYAAAELARFGTFASRRPAVERVDALLRNRGLVRTADTHQDRVALADDLLAGAAPAGH